MSHYRAWYRSYRIDPYYRPDQKGTKGKRDKKKHATSQDKKITEPLGTKKNHATSGDKKNHAISQDKRVTLSIASKLVHNAPNCSKWHQICPNRYK